MAKAGRKKPTVKQIGEFTLNIYEKVRQLEKIAVGNRQALLSFFKTFEHYLEMNGEVDKFNDYLDKKVEEKDEEERKVRKTRKKKQTKGGGTTETSSKPSKRVRPSSS